MDPEFQKKFDEQQKKIDAIYVSVEKTRKYFLISMWITVITIVLPLIGLSIMIPFLFKTLSSSLSGLL